jgi:lipoprotein-releasing system permease protein
VYKLLLCWRYLRTRFLALVCIISVMLGVATLVVVNSVMSGFSTKLKQRLHELISDVVIETPSYDGFPLTDKEMIDQIMASPAGRHIEALTPTVEVVAMANFDYAVANNSDSGFFVVPERQKVTRPVHLIGINPEGRAAIGGFAEYLTNPEQKADPEKVFQLGQAARSRFEWQNPVAAELPPLAPPGWPAGFPPPPAPPPQAPRDPQGVIVGFAIASYRVTDPDTKLARDVFVLHPGDTINLLTIGVGKREIVPVQSPFVVTGYIQTQMAEYDANYVFVPLDYLQTLRGTPGRSTHIQIKLKDFSQAKFVTTELKKLFPSTNNVYQVSTWEEKQGALLAAIDIERGILNLLLFLIIGVAGFSILAIFSMIVVEKTRDIGILKSLGASNMGILSIFLGYGFMLGVVGSLLGTAIGLAITFNINEIEKWIAHVTGRQIFDRSVYYFAEIPTNVQPLTVVVVNVVAIAIAVAFSVLPALRAALLQPVRALRFE